MISEHLTEIVQSEGMGDGLIRIIARGVSQKHCNRPMFEVLSDVSGFVSQGGAWGACAACLDMSRSWNCPDHPDTGIEGESEY